MVFLIHEPLSLALNRVLPALIPIGVIGLWRWGMFVFRLLGWFLYSAQPPSQDDKFKTRDVTLIIPTIDCDEEALHEAMRSWIMNEPHEIIIVTVERVKHELEDIAARSIARDITRVLTVDVANKRHQLVKGIRAATTPLVCFTDDDAIWNDNFLKWLVAPFNDDRMGGTGSNQIMRPNDLTKPPTAYERIADMRLSGRMLEACASTFYDGSVSCLSGRTALYHRRIIDDAFPEEFTDEKWLGKYNLISGDDKFMTRWIVKNDWKMSMQVSPECTLATTFKADSKFFVQILRWTRNTWRSDCKSLLLERHIWMRYPVQALLMVDRMISPFTLMSGPVLFLVSMVQIRKFEAWYYVASALFIYIIWVLVSRTLRIVPHLYRCPEDFTYLPIFIGYQYYFACLKVYALFTLHITSWGTRDASNFVKDPDREAAHELEAHVTVKLVSRNTIAMNKYRRSNVVFMRNIHRHYNRNARMPQELDPTSPGADPVLEQQAKVLSKQNLILNAAIEGNMNRKMGSVLQQQKEAMARQTSLIREAMLSNSQMQLQCDAEISSQLKCQSDIIAKQTALIQEAMAQNAQSREALQSLTPRQSSTAD